MSHYFRRLIPAEVKQRIRRSRLYLSHRSEATNVYFTCVQKTASRWLKRVLKDERVFRASGLDYLDYMATLSWHHPERRSLTEMRFSTPFPVGKIVGPLYTAFGGYQSIPKPDDYRAFFVFRDPRDIVVSWYYSMRYSHQPMGGLLDGVRRELQSGTEREGLKRAIELLAGPAQLFPALRSWVRAPERDDRVILVRYEDLTGQDAAASFGKLFAHCDIRLTPKTLSELLEDYSFEKMSGRRQGAEDVGSHFRKGRAGDWKEHFDGDLMRHFRAVTGDLLEVLNYD